MKTRWQGALFSTLLGVAGVPATAYQPNAQPPETSAVCPPVVQGFLKAAKLFLDPPEHARPLY